MERPELENERRRRPPKDKEKVVQCAAKRMLALVPATKPPAPPNNQVQLAALAVDLNVRLRSADMPAAMQERVIRHARVLVDTNADNKRFNPTHLAMCLKKEFDGLYGPAWHCIIGKSFGSFVTHASGGFVYFSIDKLSFLLFKTEVELSLAMEIEMCLFSSAPPPQCSRNDLKEPLNAATFEESCYYSSLKFDTDSKSD